MSLTSNMASSFYTHSFKWFMFVVFTWIVSTQYGFICIWKCCTYDYESQEEAWWKDKQNLKTTGSQSALLTSKV